jgi:hypothetical protein
MDTHKISDSIADLLFTGTLELEQRKKEWFFVMQIWYNLNQYLHMLVISTRDYVILGQSEFNIHAT